MECQSSFRHHFFDGNDLLHGRCAPFNLDLLKIHSYVKALNFRSDACTGGRDHRVWEYIDK